MNVIHRNIYVTQHLWIQPIEIVRGSKVRIEFQVLDYDVPNDASVKAYARRGNTSTAYASDCSISGNLISFIPPNGFFAVGSNKLQIEINGTIIPFSIDVQCEFRISNAEDDETPEQVQPLLERLDAAAQAANTATVNANSAAKSMMEAEKKRVSAESARASAETARVSAETARVTAETGRVDAENARQTAASNAVQNAEKATADCIAATKSATDAASALLSQAATIALQINADDGGLDILVFEEDT